MSDKQLVYSSLAAKSREEIMAATVAELTVSELRDLISEVVGEKLDELVGDPDEGLELRPQLVEQLRESMGRVARGERGIPLEEAVSRLRLG
ncbi:MAG TPA: hypothetical protein VGV61_06130 [Thermoanaerobaculia bacterium]|nr:hypothetical protein [Thermoanaerobaculia bacterium]